MKQKIYFDMDGVLADFDKGIHELCGIIPVPQDERNEEQKTAMWNQVRDVGHFYYKLDPIAEGVELFHILYHAFPGQVEILSAQPSFKRQIFTAEQDKRDWCEKYLPDIPVHITLRRQKVEYAKGNILIDDFPDNIVRWESAGGIGILFSGKKDDVLDRLKELGIYVPDVSE